MNPLPSVCQKPEGPAVPAGRILELDGLRALSVLGVIVAHLSGLTRIVAYPVNLVPLMDVLGATGVQIFFVISGFIITRLQMGEIKAAGSVSILQFYIKRFFRIIPAYWTYLLVITILWWVGEIPMKTEWLMRSLLFISDFKWYPGRESWFCGHSWSLSVEEQYYLAFSLFMFCLAGKRARGLLGLLTACYVGTVFSARLSWSTHLEFVAYLSPFKYIIAGVLMAMAWDRLGPLLERLPAAVPFLLLGFLFLRPALEPFHVLDMILMKVPEGLVAALLVGWVIRHPAACPYLRWRFFQWLGAASYSFYLWQQLFSAPRELYGHLVLSTPILGQVLLVACAAASFYGIERPCIRLARRICAKMEPRRSAIKSHDSVYVAR